MLDSPFVSGTHIIISSQVADVEMTVHIGFVNLALQLLLMTIFSIRWQKQKWLCI